MYSVVAAEMPTGRTRDFANLAAPLLIRGNKPLINSQATKIDSNDWRCPNCGSEQFQKLSMVYDAGTSLSLDIGRGYFRGGGSVTAVGVSGSASNLARRVAPPRTYAWVAALLMVALWVISFLVSAVVAADRNDVNHGPLLITVIASSCFIVIVSFYFFLAFRISEQRRIAPLMERWQRSYLCLRCGNIFEESPDTGLRVQ